MSEQALDSQDIIRLLSKLKESTPEYPVELLAARKAAFLNAAVATQIPPRWRSGKGGGDGGASGTGSLGGMSAAQSILLQAVIGVWIIAAMLTAAYVFRDQIVDLLRENGIVTLEVTQAPLNDPIIPATIAPATEVAPTETTPLADTPAPGNDSGIEPSEEIQEASPDSKENPGLHLGQTPGAPDTPNQEKPDSKPDNPKKPNK
jgi:hypothetical protein